MSRRVITRNDAELLNANSESVLKSMGIDAAILPEAPKEEDNYSSRITKYIPAEIISAFIAIDGILKTVADASIYIYWFIFLFCLILTPVYIWRVTDEEKLPLPKGQITISTLSFFCWALAFGGPFTFYSWYKPYIGSILVIMVTLLIPLFTNVKGSKNP